MTFRSLSGAALFLAVVGTAQACGPQPPACNSAGSSGCPAGISMPRQCPYIALWQSAASPTLPPLTPPVPVPVQPPQPPPVASVSGWNLSIAEGKLHLQTADGMRQTCEKLTILVNGADPVEAAVVGNQIRIASGKDVSGGAFLQATADRVSRSGVDGALLTLEGNAKLTFTRQGKKLDASADRISVHLATGQVVSEMGSQVYPPPILPVGIPSPIAYPQPMAIPYSFPARTSNSTDGPVSRPSSPRPLMPR